MQPFIVPLAVQLAVLTMIINTRLNYAGIVIPAAKAGENDVFENVCQQTVHAAGTGRRLPGNK